MISRTTCFSTLLTTCVLAVSLYGTTTRAASLPTASPESVGMDADHLRHIDGLVTEAISAGQLPGCVVLIGRGGHVVFERAYGERQVDPERIPMTTDTLFDLASLTKPIATATSVMILVERGLVRLRDPVADHIPEFAASGKDQITVEQLLTHQGGLIPDNPLADYESGPEMAWERIFALTPQTEPGTKFVYTDVGFLVLAEIVRRHAGQNIHDFSQQYVFRPLGMNETGYLPEEALRRRAAPTEKQEGKWLVGEVHDPRARLLGGIAGHAGLFSTAADLAVYAHMMISGGAGVLAPSTIDEMTRPRDVAGNRRGLGWDMRSSYSRNRGELLSKDAFGHGGFTGTVIWIDPELDLFYVFLSNRLHPDGEGSVNDLAGRIGAIAAAAIRKPIAAAGHSQSQPVQNGIDVLAESNFQPLAGRRVGLITNHTGVDASGTRTATLLFAAPQVELVALFSPEHGIYGRLDQSHISDARHEETGVPIYSLYGQARRPRTEQLSDIDTLVFDIQDIGTRFYTYISTMGLAMEAAADARLRFVVLDRPNPLGGTQVSGPVLDAGSESFVGYHRLPIRHGMTVGELAQLFRAERSLDLDLEVIPCEGWQRDMLWDATGLTWINPSPNMRSLTQALLYPGVGILETTNLSVGRGTDTPFEVVGAPWIDGRQLAAKLNSAHLHGIRFVPIRFTPAASRHAGQECGGVNLIITHRDTFQPIRTGLSLALALRRLYPQEWDTSRLNRLLGNQAVYAALLAGKPIEKLEGLCQPDLGIFRALRERYLIY